MGTATDRGFPLVAMTMADADHCCGEIVSNFLLNTCIGLRRRLNDHNILSLAFCVEVSSTSQNPSDDEEVVLIPLSTGSVAELYILPMLSCVGDFD